MKRIKKILNTIVISAIAILFAIPNTVFAVGFDAEKAYDSVFVIVSGPALGSGFAIGKNCIVTNAHVINNKMDITVTDHDDKEYKATAVGIDVKQDIAVLVVENAKFKQLGITKPEDIVLGSDVYAIGAPKSMAYTLTKGVVSTKDRKINGSTYIQIDAPINEGNSGGPVLDDTGKVIGMATLKMNDSEGIGLAIPAAQILDFVKSIGIKVNDDGNVVGTVSPDSNFKDPTVKPDANPKQPTNNKDQDTDIDKEQELETQTQKDLRIAIIVATSSIILNIILIICLIYKNSKNKGNKKAKKVPCDPSERTDFEIEILE